MEADTTRRGATWFDRDFPVLRATAHLVQASPYNHCMTYEVAAEAGFAVEDVVKAISNLKERYLYAKDESSLAAKDYIITGLTAEGLEATDVWPASDALAERLVAAIEAALDSTPEGSPKANRLKVALIALKDLSVGVSGNVLGQVLAVALGVGTT